MKIRERAQQIINSLSKGLYEKEEAIKLALLAAVSGESIFLLGPPGVAKSLIARRLKHAFKEGNSFEYLMNKFSTPDEIFGPVSIKKLKDEDKYERLTEKYMPGAKVVFLDEIWKAGPSIQNALLTILNEKIYRNGEEEVKVDIKCIVSASNELPTQGEGLEALWDRFLIRYLITEIKQKGNFIDMITNTEDVYQDHLHEEVKLSNAELEAWDQEIQQIELPSEVLNTLQVVKHKLEEVGNSSGLHITVYDRRWKKAVRLLRTAAFLNGRKEVDLMDCFLLIHCLWSEPKQIEGLKNVIGETIRKHGYSIALNLSALKKELDELDEEVKKETKIPHTETSEMLYLVDKQFYEVQNIGKVFDGKYVKQAEFDRLGIGDYTAIGLYDENFKLTYKIKSKKAKDENQLDVFHNAQVHIFPLKTVKQEVSKYLYKAPHPLVKAHWDRQIIQLQSYVKSSLDKIDTEVPKKVSELRQNLFVPADLSELVTENLKESQHALQQLSVQIEKIKHYYESV